MNFQVHYNMSLISLKMSTAAVTLTQVKLIWINRFIYIQDKHLPNQSRQFAPASKVSNVKNFNDRDDLENKVKVKLMTCNIRSCHAFWV